MIRPGVVFAVLCTSMASARLYAASADAMVCMNPEATVMWGTVTAADPLVQLDWPAGAVSAVLSVDGRDVLSVSDPLAKSCRLPLALPADRFSEVFSTLAVEYRDASGAAVGSASARVARVLRGNGTAIPFVADETSRKWGVYRGSSAVLPVPIGLEALEIDGSAATGEFLPGWYWWKNAVCGKYGLLLADDGSDVAVEVFMGLAGLQLFFK